MEKVSYHLNKQTLAHTSDNNFISIKAINNFLISYNDQIQALIYL